MEGVYYVPDLKNNILSMGRLLEKGFSIFMKDRMLYLKDNNGRMFARLEMTKNRIFILNLKINTISFRHEWKVKDEEVQTVETEVAKNKALVVAHLKKMDFSILQSIKKVMRLFQKRKTFLLQHQKIRKR